jgi:hypothetical protein
MFCDQDDVWLPDKVTLDRQAAAFAARYDERVAPAERAMLRAFCTLHANGFFGRRRLMLKYNFLLSDWWQNFMMLLR